MNKTNKLTLKKDYEVYIELLNCRLKAQQDLCNDFGKGCTIWVIILGFMLKFIFSTDTTPEMISYICLGGISFTVLGLLMNILTYKASKRIDTDILSINKLLDSPLLHLENNKLHYALFASTLFHILVALTF